MAVISNLSEIMGSARAAISSHGMICSDKRIVQANTQKGHRGQTNVLQFRIGSLNVLQKLETLDAI